jgi:GH25 family lysozyme M1 (1,4-beta-N-acetylmuramidase)
MTTVLGIDVSGYQDPERVNYPELYAHGFRFVVVKLGQYLTEEHVTLARAGGFEVGGYWWNDPLDDPHYQATCILEEVRRLALRFAGLDVEQFWRDWVAYWKWTRKEIPLSEVPTFTPAEISNNAGQVMELVKTLIKVPWLLYSAEWFLMDYAPPIMYWLQNYDLWLAQYVDGRWQDKNVGWDLLAAMASGARPLPPVQPLAGKYPRIWQISGSLIYPKRSWWDSYDTDLFMGGPDDLAEWLGRTPSAPTTPTFIPYQVKSTADLGLRIRAEPNTSSTILGKLYPNQPAVTILEVNGVWGRFCAGWISLTWTKKVI